MMPCETSLDREKINNKTEPKFLEGNNCKSHPIIPVGIYQYQECAPFHLGEGSYGLVFKGRNNKNGDSVAIKKVPNDQLKPGEIGLMRSLKKCDFLVTLIDCVKHDAQFTHVILELCDIDLDRHLGSCTENGRLSDNNFRVVLNSLARGYGVLYLENIIHRDIKPQNILLKYSRPIIRGQSPEIAVAKITDFGISRVLDSEERQFLKSDKTMRRVRSSGALSNVAGTPYYMAPEVGANLIGEVGYGFSVDMWSIGCVLYQCIAGEPPFNEQHLCKLFLKAACFNYDAYACPQPPTDTPGELSGILQALLEMDAHKRLRPPEFYCAALIYASGNGPKKVRRNSFSTPSNKEATVDRELKWTLGEQAQ